MRPIFLEYPQAQDLYDEDDEFLFGHDLLAVPVVTEKVDKHHVHLPPGIWYDHWDDTKHDSGERISSLLELDQMPLYVRAGAILPEQAVVQSTTEAPKGPLELRVYPGADCRGSLYLDDGHTFAYLEDGFVRIRYSCEAAPDSIMVTSAPWQGDFRPWWTSVELEIFGAANEPKEVRAGESLVSDWRFDSERHAVIFALPDSRSGWTVRVTY